MRYLGICAVVVMALAMWAGSAVPAFSADSGTVNAQVSVATPCITVSPTTIQFGTHAFSAGSESTTGAAAIGYASCAPIAEKIFAKATDATGADATWSLTSAWICNAVNTYNVRIWQTTSPSALVQLTKANQELESLGVGATGTFGYFGLAMPCTGSSGAGQTMSLQVIFTATF